MASIPNKILFLEEIFNQIGFGRFQIILVLFCGILQSFDAMELLVLAFLGPVLSCTWQITVLESSLLTTSVFLGAMIGGIVFGRLSDKYGRKPILILSSFLLIYTALLSSFCPVVYWLILLRGFLGLSLGGIMVSLSTLTLELIPIKNRGMSLMIILGFWPIGSYFVTTLAMFIIPHYGWRVFIFMITLPLLFMIPPLMWIPESPRFLMLKNKKSEAILILNKMAKCNRRERITDIEYSKDVEIKNGGFTDLLRKKYLFTTISTNTLLFVCGISYYSVILMVTFIDNIPHPCLQSRHIMSDIYRYSNRSIDNSCCLKWSNSIFKHSYISTTGEVLFLIISILLIEFVGRRLIMAIFTALVAVCFVLLNLCLSVDLTSLMLLFIRGTLSATFNVNYIYVSEVFPTSSRSSALGMGNLSAKVGSMMSSFIVNIVMIEASFLIATLFFCGLHILSFILIIFLPYETRGRKLYQTVSDNDS